MSAFQDYLNALKNPYQKLCRLRFLQPDGSTAFILDGNPKNPRSAAFISDGSITASWQNGRRRNATVTLSNIDGEFDYNVNQVWYGTEIALDEGLILPNGEEYYIQQGVFLVDSPTETINPNKRTATYNLVDKSAMLDGTLFGNLEGTYQVLEGTNIFQPIKAILELDRGNGYCIDRVNPIFTSYFNGKTQTLPDGTTANLTDAPYDIVIENGTYWDVIVGCAAIVNAWVGYDETGALRLDPSQDDILDIDKPVLWDFDDATMLGRTYTTKNEDVFNDFIVIGERLDNNYQPTGRAQNLDFKSDTNIQTIGRKTKRVEKAGFASDTQCQDYAQWMLKRTSVLHHAITISCPQIFHIRGNDLITVKRTDRNGEVERHLVQGFSRPLVSTGTMQINATSVLDFPNATLTTYP